MGLMQKIRNAVQPLGQSDTPGAPSPRQANERLPLGLHTPANRDIAGTTIGVSGDPRNVVGVKNSDPLHLGNRDQFTTPTVLDSRSAKGVPDRPPSVGVHGEMLPTPRPERPAIRATRRRQEERLMGILNLLRSGGTPSEPTPGDRLTGVERALADVHAQLEQLVKDREAASSAIATIDNERRSLVVRAKTEGDADAQQQLDDLNLQRRAREDELRNLVEAIVQLDRKRTTLDTERLEAQRESLVKCVQKLCVEQDVR